MRAQYPFVGLRATCCPSAHSLCPSMLGILYCMCKVRHEEFVYSKGLLLFYPPCREDWPSWAAGTRARCYKTPNSFPRGIYACDSGENVGVWPPFPGPRTQSLALAKHRALDWLRDAIEEAQAEGNVQPIIDFRDKSVRLL